MELLIKILWFGILQVATTQAKWDICDLVDSPSNTSPADNYYDQYEQMLNTLKRFYPQYLTNYDGINFTCELFSNPGPATTVNELTPYDISVVGAMGDSITAAFGANADNILQIIEYRGVSWSVGGDEALDEVGTIPNIIKEYNPNVKGFATGTGTVDSEGSNLNVAVSGSIAQDMPGQARLLIERMRNDPDIDFNNDWKLVTLFIGGNNLCKYCENKTYHSVVNYYRNVREALDILHSELPKTFVNLVMILDITILAPLKTNNVVCKFVHNCFACPCGEDEETSQQATKYQNALEQLVDSGEYEENDFTVVIQPLLVEMELPLKDGEPDLSYFSPDCFHFSGKGHKEAATALWNNMVQPIGLKQRKWNLGEDIVCPTENAPYFYTKENSGIAVPPVPYNEF